MHPSRLHRLIPALLLAAGFASLPAAPAQQTAPAPERQGSVWKVSDADSTVYLAGSVHLLREEDHPIAATYDEAYADSAEVVFEVDMAEMLSPDGMAKMQALGTYPADDSLDRHLKPETIEQIRQYLATHPSGAAYLPGLPRLRPGMIFLSISSLEAMRLKARPDLGLEIIYHQRATADGKPTRGLETLEYQMGLFNALTDAEIDALLAKTLADAAGMPEVLEKLITHWHAGDDEALDQLLNDEMDSADDGGRFKKLLLTDRNRAWVPEIEKALKGSRNVFFLVGAGHLVGEEGVVALLREKGYTVEKVRPRQPAALKKAA